MKAIDFAVSDNAGGLQRGVVSSEAQTHVIQAQSGQEISLNLRQIDLTSQQRVGEDLIVTLTDGRVITIVTTSMMLVLRTGCSSQLMGI